MRCHILACVILLLAALSRAQQNTMTIRNRASVALSNHPVQFGRPFVVGEIATFPQVLIGGVAAPTQADVKQRWSDGSVKFAVISFILPSLAVDASVTLSFGAQSSSNGGSPALTQANMLETQYNFGAIMEFRNTTLVTANARTMLSNGHWSYWTNGGIATTVIIADHSAARSYDVGFDANKSIRPIFHATFWPSISKVLVRFIGEISNSQVLQNLIYTLTLKTGNTSPATVLTTSYLPHAVGARWTQSYWIGGAPPKEVDIDHNTAYLMATRFIPYYNLTVANLTESRKTANWNSWQSSPKDLFDPGSWTKYMPATGGRDDIGIITKQNSDMLFSRGDWRMREIALANADLAGAWSMQVREGDPNRWFDKNKTVRALGKTVSMYGRPTCWLLDNRDSGPDAVKPLSSSITFPVYSNEYFNYIPASKQGWIHDDAHQPDPYYIPYIVTGDYFYLESLQLWAGAGVLGYNTGDADYCRGPASDPSVAGIKGQIRSHAWIFRTRVNAAWASPDNTPERFYFHNVTNEAIAVWEGGKNLLGTQFDGTLGKNWGLRVLYRNLSLPGLYTFENDETLVDGPVDTAVCGAVSSLWMNYMCLSSFGWAKERGFPIGPFLSYISRVLTRQFTDANWDPKCVALYRHCFKRRDGTFYSSFSESKQAYTSPFVCSLSDCADTNHGYGTMATAAASFLVDEAGGATTWNYLRSNCRHAQTDTTLSNNPKWMVIPRPADSMTPRPSGGGAPSSSGSPTPTPAPTPSPNPSPTGTTPSAGSSAPSASATSSGHTVSTAALLIVGALSLFAAFV